MRKYLYALLGAIVVGSGVLALSFSDSPTVATSQQQVNEKNLLTEPTTPEIAGVTATEPSEVPSEPIREGSIPPPVQAADESAILPPAPSPVAAPSANPTTIPTEPTPPPLQPTPPPTTVIAPPPAAIQNPPPPAAPPSPTPPPPPAAPIPPPAPAKTDLFPNNTIASANSSCYEMTAPADSPQVQLECELYGQEYISANLLATFTGTEFDAGEVSGKKLNISYIGSSSNKKGIHIRKTGLKRGTAYTLVLTANSDTYTGTYTFSGTTSAQQN